MKGYQTQGMQAMNILPEERLMWAVLERGILDYLGMTKPTDEYAHHRWRANARGWIDSFMDDEMSFIRVCETLDLCHVTIRKRIHKLAKTMPRFEPAAQGAVVRVLDRDESDSFALEKNPDRKCPDSVELERKRA